MAKRKRQDGFQDVTDKTSAEQALQNSVYEESQAVQDARQQLEAYQQNKPGDYVSGYQEKIDSMLDRILNREGFSYDFAADPLYQGYRQQYLHQGRLAMQDSMAGAAALTGGYGSSYSMAMGSQAYQGQLNRLNDKIPALYQAALDRYDSEGRQMRNTLDAWVSAEEKARKAHQESVDSYFKGLKQYADMADSAYQQDYGEYQDMMKALEEMRDYYAGQDQQAIENEMDRQAHELAVKKFEESVRQWQAEQAAEAARQAEETRRWEAELAAQQSHWRDQLQHSKDLLDYRKEKDAAKAEQETGGKDSPKPRPKPHLNLPTKDLTKREKFLLYLGEMKTGLREPHLNLTKKEKDALKADLMADIVKQSGR